MALRIGMSKREFLRSTPKDIKARFKAYKEQKEEEYRHGQYTAWLTGMYVRCAIGSAFSKSGRYPDNPLTQTTVQEVANKTGKTEEELNGEKVLMTMLVMEANAELAKLTAE